MGDIEKIQVNALIDRYVMQVEQPLNSYYYNSSENNYYLKEKTFWGRESHVRTAGMRMGESKIKPISVWT